ncbi:hypothetical protein V6Z12_D11G017700 [Gossypium hirsutum]
MPIKNIPPYFSHPIFSLNYQMRQPPAPPVSSGEPPRMSSTSNSTCSPNICSGSRRSRRSNNGSHLPQTQQELEQRKPVTEAGVARMSVAPTVVYSHGMKLAGAEGVPECAICLSEFVEGDGIQVLAKCKHGFHVQCIQRWLASHSSCPTCRSICLPPSPSPEETTRECVGDGSQPVVPDPEP